MQYGHTNLYKWIIKKAKEASKWSRTTVSITMFKKTEEHEKYVCLGVKEKSTFAFFWILNASEGYLVS